MTNTTQPKVSLTKRPPWLVLTAEDELAMPSEIARLIERIEARGMA